MDAVRQFVRAVRWRLGVGGLLGLGARSLCAALGVATALAVAERLLAPGVSVVAAAFVPVLVAVALAVVLGAARWPRMMAAALRADGWLGLDERLSSALAAGEGPMAELVRADAARRIDTIDLTTSFPVTWPTSARAVPLLGALLVVALLVPELDLAGWGRARSVRVEAALAARAAAGQAQGRLQALRDSARRQGLGEAAKALDWTARELAAAGEPGARPREARAAADRVALAVDTARRANDEAQAKAETPDERDRRRRAAGLLAQAARAAEQFREQVGGQSSSHPTRPLTRDGSDTSPGAQQAFVRKPPPTAPAPKVATLVDNLIGARAAADEAMARDDVPWRYRAIVKRYFSPDENSFRPGR